MNAPPVALIYTPPGHPTLRGSPSFHPMSAADLTCMLFIPTEARCITWGIASAPPLRFRRAGSRSTPNFRLYGSSGARRVHYFLSGCLRVIIGQEVIQDNPHAYSRLTRAIHIEKSAAFATIFGSGCAPGHIPLPRLYRVCASH